MYTRAMTRITNFRLTDNDLHLLDSLAAELSRDNAANGRRAPSRAEAVRVAVREAHERRAPKAAAERAAWDALLALSPAGDTTMLTLIGAGEGEPIPASATSGTTPDNRRAVYRTPELWPSMAVSATLDGRPVDLPLVVDEPYPASLHFDVYLTDAEGHARLYLGALSRVVDERPALYDNRLFRIAEDLALPARTSLPEERQ